MSSVNPSPSPQKSRPRRSFRNVHGVLLLDKAGGITSNKALRQARHLFSAKKAGHTGNLDPLATGMLPVCFGEATKISAYLLDADKAYSAVARLGAVTDTGDSDGVVIAEKPLPESLTSAMLEDVLCRFKGSIEQVPPMYSALKHEGRRLYELARAGKTVERKPRSVVISALQLTGFGQGTFSIDVRCSKGTYIRSLVQDIGDSLGCGAHLTALRRTAVNPFAAETLHTFDELQALHDTGGTTAIDQLLLPMDAALQHMPAVQLLASEVARFRNGNPAMATESDAEARAAGAGQGTAADDSATEAKGDAANAQSDAETHTETDGTEQTVRVYAPDCEFIGIGTVAIDPTDEHATGNAGVGCSDQTPAAPTGTGSDRLMVQPRRVLNLSL